MAVAIRLQRIGKPHQAYYRLVAIDKRRGAQGKPIEVLGHYDPRKEKAKEKLALEPGRVEHWLKNGALPSDTAASLLKAAGLPVTGAKPAAAPVKAKPAAKAA